MSERFPADPVDRIIFSGAAEPYESFGRIAMPVSEEALQTIHRDLLVGDPTASARLAELAYLPLCEAIRRFVGRLGGDFDLADEAVGQTWEEIVKCPHQYDPSKSTFWSFLYGSAIRDAQNLLAKEKRKKFPREFGNLVEIPSRDGNKEWQDFLDDPPSWFSHAIAAFDEQERIVWDACRNGVSVEETVVALGVSSPEATTDAGDYYRIRERIMKRLKRERERHEPESE